MSGLLKFIPISKVEAQALDALSQPTFGTIDTGPGTGTTASILVSSSVTQANIGDTFKIRINIKTNSTAINQYKIIVQYDATKLTVVDKNTQANGVQINLLDTIFQAENPATDNVALNGTITLTAKTASGTAFSVNRDVAEIEFQAQTAGTAEVKVVEGATGSSLLRSNNSTIQYTSNFVRVEVKSTSQNPQPEPTNPTPEPTNPTPVQPTPENGGQIPDTAIGDGLDKVFGIGFGIVLLIMGINLAIGNKARKKRQ